MGSSSFTRRHALQIGGLSLLGSLTAPATPLRAAQAPPKRRSCIFIMLQGGPSHLDLWDPKPEASSEVRGQFQTIGTKIPGIRFGELLPGSAAIADELAIVRSVSHEFTNHIAGTYITLTGSHAQLDRDREAHADDFPGPGAVLNYLEKSAQAVPRSVSLPSWLSIPGPSNRMPGQYGGMLGSVYDPFVIEGDPASKKYNPLSLKLSKEMGQGRVGSRLTLLEQLDRSKALLEHELSDRYDHLLASAYSLVIDGRVRSALDLSKEPAKVRDRYGRTKFGQSMLLARRLVEAGVQFVGQNEFNQRWDTHGNLFRRYRDIVPAMDRAFSALVSDLKERGMLDDTLVIKGGEFGRTPVVNSGGGRDHWPNAYSMVLAGGGIAGGAIYGQTDNKGAEVADRRVAPEDILATMWQQLGINPKTEFYDRIDRPRLLSTGSVINEIVAS